MPKFTKGHEVFFSEFIQKYLSIPIYSPGFKALASIVFEIFCWQDFIHIFSKSHNSGKGHNPDGEKKYVRAIFSWGIHIWNFKTLACTVQKLCYASKSVTDGRTDAQTSLKQYAPPTSSKVGGLLRSWGHNKMFTCGIWTNNHCRDNYWLPITYSTKGFAWILMLLILVKF